MAWYKTGSVSVTSGQTTVTGIGTNFASNVRVGDGFKGPNGLWYEIVNIASQTVLGIFPAYAGPTVTANTNYMVAPLQGYNKESADRLRAITDSFPTALDGKQDKSQNLTSFSSLVGSADRLPYFTGVGALSLATLTSKARELLSYTTEAQMLGWMSGENTNPLGGTGSTDLNTLRTKRTDYYITNGVNTPTGGNGYLTVIPLVGTTECYQRYRVVNGSGTYERNQLSGNWGSWKAVIFAEDIALDTAYSWNGSRFKGWQAAAPDSPPVNSVAVGLDLGYAENRRFQMALDGNGTLYTRVNITDAPNTGANWRRVVTQESAILDPALNTGGIVSSGSNANGTYTKYADGSITMYHAMSLAHVADTELVTGWNLPHPALMGGVAIAGVAAPVTTQSYSVTKLAIQQASTAVATLRSRLTTAQNYTINFLFMGRWK